MGAPNTWVLSNHDTVRHASRYGLADPSSYPAGIQAHDEQPDEAIGLRRARASAMLELALPGSAYIYQGDELALPEHTTLADEHRTDPYFFRTNGEEPGRDGCRIPMPWDSQAPGLGFAVNNTAADGEPGTPWLPAPESYTRYAADRQVDVPGSTFELYRTLLGIRGELGMGGGRFAWAEQHAPENGVLAFTVTVDGARPDGAGGSGAERTVLVMANLGPDPVAPPEGVERTVLSVEASEALVDGALAADTAGWFLLGPDA